MVNILILLVLLLLLSFDCFRCVGRNEIPYSPFIILISIVGTAIFTLDTIINPIEVYRGNTTLEITYRDSIPVDSIVVLKK